MTWFHPAVEKLPMVQSITMSILLRFSTMSSDMSAVRKDEMAMPDSSRATTLVPRLPAPETT